jgi:DNA uptake protein ComE-like DNA-binding protein
VRQFLRSFFGTSRKEVNGVIVLATIFLLSMVYPRVHRFLSHENEPLSQRDEARLDSLVVLLSQPEEALPIKERFNFDPNTISNSDLLRLGFEERVIKQIVNYRNKGGRFYIKNDLYKIYSIDSVLVDSLYNYIELPERRQKQRAASDVSDRSNKSRTKSTANQSNRLSKDRVVERFDLNRADTAMLQTIYGIGSVFANRIITFRDRLGGFVSENQLFEVYNLDSAVVDSLLIVGYVPDQPEIIKLPINSISEEMLARHPYVSRQQARLIIAYRNQHGSYYSTKELEKVYLVNKSDIDRLLPYLNFE